MSDEPSILLLGELGVLRRGQVVRLPASKKTRALLGYLAVSGRAHTREELCDLLWQGPDDPRAALRWSLTKLREALGPHAIDADRERIALRGVSTDLDAVRAALKGGAQAADLANLSHAHGLFRGELLEGLSLPECYRFHEWCTLERDRARALCVGVLAALIEQSADPQEALRWARECVAIDPVSEAAHIAVIRRLSQLGRRREALAQYQSCSRILEQEAGAKPSAALLEAKMQIGAHAALSASASQSTPPAPLASSAPSTTAATGDPLSTRPPFVGREAERELIRLAASDAARGAARPLLVFLGESGIGKTRLLDELGQETRALGGLVLSGRAYEAETIRPYGPWIDALSVLEPARVPAALRDELGSLFAAHGTEAKRAPNRETLFDGVVRLLTHLSASSAPIAILLDDAQWFDEATAALLHYVARALVEARVVIACAARPGELSDNVAALRSMRALARGGRSRSVTLSPLDSDALVSLARSLSPGVDAERVAAGSAGNPLFALELTRAAERGDDAKADSIAALIDERLARLDDRSREFVSWAAALGTRFDIPTLERVTGISPLELGTCIAGLERHGIVRASPDGAAYDFVHDLLRAGAYRQLSEPRRRGVHRNIARAIAAMDGDDAARAGDVVHHAALGGDNELAARSALAGGQRCLRMFAGSEAARLVEVGRRHLALLPRRERIRLSVSLLSVLVFSGVWVRHGDSLKDELARAITQAEDAGLREEVGEGLQALSVLQYDGGDLGGAHETTLRVPAAVRSADALTRARHLGNTARCLAMLERDMDQAHAMYAEARELADQAGTCLVSVEWAAAILFDFAGDYSQAAQRFERVLELARAEEDRWVEYEALRALVQLELESGVPAAATRYSSELVAVAAKMGEGSEEPTARALEALLRFRAGVAGAPALEQALARLRDVDAKGMLSYALTLAADGDLGAQRIAEAARRAAEALQAASAVSRRSQMALARVVLARAALVSGDRKRASSELDATRADFDQPLALNARARAAVTLARSLLG